MKLLFIFLITLFNSILFSECDNLLQSQCYDNCEWVEDIESGDCSNYNYNYNQCNAIDDCEWSSYQINCGTATGYSDCDISAGCSYSWLTYTCSGWTTISDCSGGNYEIDNGFCQEIEAQDCSDILHPGVCTQNDDCEWVEDIVYGNCGNLSISDCYDYPNECYVDSNPGWYPSSGPYCTGGTYQINNSYCQQIEMPECSDMNQSECSNDSSCDWIVDIEYGNCSNYNNGSACDANDECFWDLCYGGYYGSWSHCCRGGAFEINNSYCEEFEYQVGDVNQDQLINVSDIVIVINLILNNSYDSFADLNEDDSLNIQDIILFVNIILE
tara:strand:+ start:613 stop:1593 length:981 start_codon:yes stop_codon:yes gene_type:complete